MHVLSSIFVATCALLATTSAQELVVPDPPALSYLYTSFVDCQSNIYTTQGPLGLRTAIPIVGGNFSGPRMNGKILNLGADWGTTDIQTGIFTADTRYNLQTDDGANIFIRTSGPAQPQGGLHLRLLFETGDKEYYWLNNVIALGILSFASQNEDGFTLRIDAWNMATDYNSTTFLNGTTYSKRSQIPGVFLP